MKKFKELIISGNFTVISWDNGQYSFYKGHQTVDSVNEKNIKPFIEYDNECEGYMPDAMSALVECLGGKSESI